MKALFRNISVPRGGGGEGHVYNELTSVTHLLVSVAAGELDLLEENEQHNVDDSHQSTQVARASVYVEVESNRLNNKPCAAQRNKGQTKRWGDNVISNSI